MQQGQRLLASLGHRCNNLLLPGSPLATCLPLVIDGHRLGLVKPDIARILTARCPSVFHYGSGSRSLTLADGLSGFRPVSNAMATAFEQLRTDGVFPCLTKGWRNELYAARLRSTRQPVFEVERSAASLLGIAQWGCHVNGYTVAADGSQRPVAMWLARRSLSKPTWPGHLDNLVGGGLPSDCDSPTLNARKEAQEEAGIPAALLDSLQPVGTVSYFYEDERGVFPDVEYCYDLALPDTFSPVSVDGEVAEFRLVPLADLPELIAQPDFKPNSGLVCLDFLLRLMSFLPNLPPSVLAKNADAEALGARRSKEEYRKMKELEEARKLAAVPAMKDEEGKDINPHIPQYIMQAPWYYGALHPTLKHQIKPAGEDEKRQPDTTASGEIITMASGGSEALNRWYKRGQAAGPRATKYRKGACANCGAATHQAKDCFQRPRARGAKWTGEDIAPDQHVQPDLKLDFEAKRDRWNGYDPASYRQVIDSYAKLEEARKQVRSSKQEAGGEEGEQRDDEDRYGDEMAMPGQKFDCKERQSVRNLRIREDTAKYLYNLDPSSAYYDPKTRAMRGNPFEGRDVSVEEAPFAGDNYIRYQGDALPMMEQQVFAWELQAEKGVDAHLQANPTRLELLHRELDEKSKEIGGQISQQILEKYGGQEHLRAADSEAPELSALSQTEQYAEYSRTGTLLRGAEAPAVRSRYDEDKKPLNHTSVWGSYWEAGKWGYKCCRSTMRNAYCTGLKGRLPAAGPPAVKDSTAAASGSKRAAASNADDGSATAVAEKKRKQSESESDSSSSSSGSSSSDDSSDSDSE
uniref:Pre-mRNA-splicing factor SLU7 n=1 Tax=Macrostomum lignano TaxID=282301 RepID=A0A1I8HEM0_9PLAT